jgi:2-dehydro-3-deoxyphosphogluconate aldolase/(4S)-4-hydroxy-2-oxoglutarate aldolase
MPGAITASEIQLAHRMGADFVKLFPVTNLGAGYVKAIKAPLSHVKLTAVGGIHETNMMDYIEAGVSGFGIGANIVDQKKLAANDYKAIAELARRYVEVVK